MDTFIQQIINGLVLGSVYALIALGYTMVYGIINLINFAHGEILMVGALTSWTVVTAMAGLGWPGWALLLVSLMAAIVVCSVLNFAVEKLAYRPLRNAPRLVPLISAIGVSVKTRKPMSHGEMKARPQRASRRARPLRGGSGLRASDFISTIDIAYLR